MTSPAERQPRRASFPLPVFKPIATYVLLGIIAVVFVLETVSGGSTDTQVLVRMGAKVTPLIASGEYWRLFTSMFLHIGIMHLFFNGYALFILGTEVERLFGWQRFLAIYLLSGLYGSLASYAFSDSLSAGASGAIFGLIGALATYFALHRQQLGKWGQRRLMNILFLIAINLFLGLTQPWIDNWAHMGGLAAGLALGWALAPRYQVAALPRGPWQESSSSATTDLRPGNFGSVDVRLRLVDRNSLARYWPALAVAVLLFVGSTVLVTQIHKGSPRSHLLRAEAAADLEDWDTVAAELEQALSKDPTLGDASTYFFLGLARNYLDQPQEAAKAYEAALELDSSDGPSRWNLALTYLELERFAEAQAQFETYLELNPDRASEVQPYLDDLRSLVP
jgi:membrane associated rhomboid family serine protease